MSSNVGGSTLSDSDSSDEERKKIKSNSVANRKRKMPEVQPSEGYGSAVNKMLKKMGYEEGKGLGKAQQGRLEPVQATSIKGRRGIGTQLPPELQPGPADWDFEEEKIVIEEEIDWIPPFSSDELLSQSITFEELQKWRKIGQTKEIISDETNFVDPTILAGILRSKDLLDEMEEKELRRAVSKSNPFETIRKGIFINRAAMKMANLDAIMGFEITNPKTQLGEKAVGENELLYFADICAGPGGFSEYVLWKKKWLAKGFGFTLKGACDFKLDDFVSGQPESFEPHYGAHDDGDIFNPENVASFMNYVLANTDGYGVHFLMADGGFSVEGKENIQEILSKQLYLSQILVAMGIVRIDGHFICKLFDIFTPFSVGLIYLMCMSFNSVAIVKPNTSRPANSERYLVCKWKKQDIGGIFEYLKESHQLMWSWNHQPDKNTNDIMELVPLQIIADPESDFFKYIMNSNNVNGTRQIQNLKKIHAFYRDENKFESRQRQVRFDCLRFWGVPSFTPRDDFRLVEQFRNSLSNKGEGTELRRSSIGNLLSSPLSWRFTILEGKQTKRNTGFYRGEGRLKVTRLEGNLWKPLQSFEKFELPKDTLVYGELAYELKGQIPNQTKSLAFHIIDGFVLGGKDISQEGLEKRIELCTVFAKAMNKGTNGFIGVRAKPFFVLDELPHLLQSFRLEIVKGEGKREKLVCPIDFHDEHSSVIQPSGILLLPITQDPWTIEFSRTNNREYWFNRKKNHSIFEIPFGGLADSSYACQKRIIWWLDDHTNLNPQLSPSGRNPQELMTDRVHAYDFIQFLNSKG